MPLSKKMKKILEGFYEAKALYDEAHERGDIRNEVKLSAEFIAYIEKFQKELNFPDEYLQSMKDALSNVQKKLRKEAQLVAELEAVRRERKKDEQEYYRLLLEQTPEGKKRTKH